MQRRAERIAREELFPESGRELMDAVGRMLADALKDVDQVVVGIDLVQSTGHDQALHDADVFGPRC